MAVITNVTSITLPGRGLGHQRPPSAALELLVFEVIKCDAR